MRSKKFIEEVNQQNTLMTSVDQAPSDSIFQELFRKVFELISSQEASDERGMDEYTSNFFKILIKIFQTSRKFLNMDWVKSLLDQLITGDKLLVVVNSLPLNLAIQMFFEAEKINNTESGAQSIIFRVYDVISKELARIKEGKHTTDPILVVYRLKNLISVSTSMLQYFLCFQTPFSDKSSSS